ncbi:copper amine oxidase N-terminal domain-containing protein [Anaerotignum propionicum]|uniref:Copper amine oxidase N-terminal domain-containing protein n=1 Tax=Anaerotignum propionicum DSM 1682 TaxID=991789 RepID=A0A110A6L6_ANAPI|nr:copper amine oxidase N-terminal domain-containing protein [Anaerotignum propionicum]AMJ39713.1 hypothetical protein CPRO_00890 [Anaerotignum propionicum DSM 1682]SHE29757.1 Copper amine oxidase N-terminal domain-containing protein [[Clostridium] propionicum DSM 1682] [Anaerotignum propionicum DSM 1682]
MKKFISFVMAGAMVASLVPATAFAKGDVTATAKIVDALEKAKDFNGVITQANAPELQLKVTNVDYTVTNPALATMDVELSLDKAEFNLTSAQLKDLVAVIDEDGLDALTGKSTSQVWEDSATGTILKKGTTEIKIADLADIAAEADNDKAVLDILKNYSGALNGTTGNDINETMTKGVMTAVIYATDGTGAVTTSIDKAAIVDLLEQGYTFAAGSNITLTSTDSRLGGAYSSTLDAADRDAIDVDTQIAWYVAESYVRGGYKTVGETVAPRLAVSVKEFDKDSVTYTFTGFFKKDDKVIIDLASTLTKTSEGTKATVSVNSKMVTADDLVYASILGKGFKVSVKKTVDVAQEEVVKLNSNGLKIESAVDNLPSKVTLKISNGFEFTKDNNGIHGTNYDIVRVDEKELTVNVTGSVDEITVKDIEIEATSAKSGAVATITAKASNNDSASCEVAKVVDYKVSFTVDKDEDIPVIYSGTNVGNAGITDDSDHMSLEVTAKETFPGAWSMRQGFNFNLPEGVYVTDVKVTDADNFYQKGVEKGTAEWDVAFFDAYQKGDHKNFEFEKRVFDDVDTKLNSDPAELTFQLELVADPTFEGDVKLTFEGALVDKQEVTIAKFVKPYTVKAEQNDVIIDYRNTEVKTPIVITEAEEGLWEKDATFKLSIEDDLLTFENDPTFTIDKDSDLKLKDDKTTKGTIQFAVKETSDKASTVTISDMKLFMSRSIPAGAYDLEIATTMSEAYDAQLLFAPDQIKDQASATDAALKALKDKWTAKTSTDKRPSESDVKKDSYVDDVCDYSDVVKAAFINVVTSGRDNDNLFTTKVVVPVGEAYLLAGEAKVELDAPAYISAAGYTMLPVRAISKALGVNTNNVLWNAETRTVTVMYAQRIITMTVGQKTIYVNGSAIPSSAAPEIKDGRTFLPLRDLGTALGVTNVNWDAATKTATLN